MHRSWFEPDRQAELAELNPGHGPRELARLAALGYREPGEDEETPAMTTTTITETQRIASDREWFGYLTLDNFDAVTERVKRLLEGRAYTWVAVNEGMGHRPEVRASLRAEKFVTSRSDLEDGRTMAHLTVCDDYGVWGLDTTTPDQRAAHERGRADKSQTYLHFTHGRYDGGKLEIEHYAPAGYHLYWVITVERTGFAEAAKELSRHCDMRGGELVPHLRWAHGIQFMASDLAEHPDRAVQAHRDAHPAMPAQPHD